jgi:hypothetical protein
VSFEADTCIALFTGCDEISDFTFDEAGAQAASEALIGQVFNLGGSYDLYPNLTRGIDELYAWIFTPYLYAPQPGSDWDVMAWCAINMPWRTPGVDGVDSTNTCWAGRLFDAASQDNGQVTYAVWTPVSAVPVPAAIWLFDSALIGLVGFGKRKSLAA